MNYMEENKKNVGELGMGITYKEFKKLNKTKKKSKNKKKK